MYYSSFYNSTLCAIFKSNMYFTYSGGIHLIYYYVFFMYFNEIEVAMSYGVT